MSFARDGKLGGVLKYRVPVFVLREVLGITRAIWLVSDQDGGEGGSSEAFYRWIQQHHPDDQRAYFAVSKHARERPELKRVGRVVDQKSFRYKVLLLLADKVVAQTSDERVIDPFGVSRDYLKDLRSSSVVSLQGRACSESVSCEAAYREILASDDVPASAWEPVR